MSHLNALWLGDNYFDSKDLPDNICQNLPNLESLNMYNNNLGGRIPSQLSQCGKLRHFTLSFNNFVGSIPQTVGNLTNLEAFYLDHNKLTGIYLLTFLIYKQISYVLCCFKCFLTFCFLLCSYFNSV